MKNMKDKIKKSNAKNNEAEKAKKASHFKKLARDKAEQAKHAEAVESAKPWVPGKQVKRTPQSKNIPESKENI